MAGSIYSWSKTPTDNQTADGDINWTEGQLPDTVNDSARQMMSRNAEFRDDLNGTLTAGGTANAITLTANSAFTTLAQGRIISFKAASSNTGAVTINVNALGSKAIRKMSPTGDVALTANDIRANGIYNAQYSTAANGGAGAWILSNPTLSSAALNNVTSTDNAVARFDGTDGALQNSGVIISDTNNITGVGTITGSGTATFATFSGSGASLTSIPAGQLTGTIADARLSGSYTGLTNISGSGTATFGTFSGSGASLTSLPAGQLTGTVASARISGSYTGITGTGALNAGSITSGFGSINIGASAFTGGTINVGTVNNSGTITMTPGTSTYLVAQNVIRSNADNTDQLGANTFRWASVWTPSLNNTSTVTISNGTTSLLVASTVFRADANNGVQLGASTFRWSNTFSVDGNFSGSVTYSSDERLKKGWKPLAADFVERLASVKVGTFDRTDIPQRQVGVGAQSIREIMPEAVIASEDGYLSVAYGNAALAACVELAKEVVALKAKIGGKK